MKLEMISCPVCGKPMPKKRMELGYNYCINCSTEKPKVCLIEGTQEGEDVDSTVTIVTQQEARLINKAKAEGKVTLVEDENALNMKTLEEQDSGPGGEDTDKRFLQNLEERDFTEGVLKDLEDLDGMVILGPDDLEAADILEEE